MKITDYCVADQVDVSALENEILENIASGWQPFGNLIVATNENGSSIWFYQPMVKYE